MKKRQRARSRERAYIESIHKLRKIPGKNCDFFTRSFFFLIGSIIGDVFLSMAFKSLIYIARLFSG